MDRKDCTWLKAEGTGMELFGPVKPGTRELSAVAPPTAKSSSGMLRDLERFMGHTGPFLHVVHQRVLGWNWIFGVGDLRKAVLVVRGISGPGMLADFPCSGSIVAETVAEDD